MKFLLATTYLQVAFLVLSLTFTACDGTGSIGDAESGPVLEEDAHYFLVGGDILLDKDNVAQNDWARTKTHVPGDIGAGLPSGAIGSLVASWITPWPESTIPYFFEDTVNDDDRTFIRGEMAKLEELSGVIYQESATDGNFIYTISRPPGITTGGSSTLGFTRNARFNFNLRRSVLHELLHGLGISHEHQRPDRDSYISMNWDGLSALWVRNFATLPDDSMVLEAYDYESIMHYSQRSGGWVGDAFSIVETDLATTGDRSLIGQRDHLSAGDIDGVRYHYPSFNLPTTVVAPSSASVGSNLRLQAEVDTTNVVGALRFQWRINSGEWIDSGAQPSITIPVPATDSIFVEVEGRDSEYNLARAQTSIAVGNLAVTSIAGPTTAHLGESVSFRPQLGTGTSAQSVAWKARIEGQGEWLDLGLAASLDAVIQPEYLSFVELEMTVITNGGLIAQDRHTIFLNQSARTHRVEINGPTTVRSGEFLNWTTRVTGNATLVASYRWSYQWIGSLNPEEWFDLGSDASFAIQMPPLADNLDVALRCETVLANGDSSQDIIRLQINH